jgi:hypothetical protein
VTERIGQEKYTDAAVSSNPVGYFYYSEPKQCTNIQPLVPLTNDKAVLHNTINSLDVIGGTAGQVGLAWGWYAISPDFGLWSGSSMPAPYPNANSTLKKIAVLMTDGEFNQPYCNGIYAGYVCPATNGDPTDQAIALCKAMKAKGITIYTIGFQLPNKAADDFMKSCATNSTTYFDADNEAELKAAFSQVAKNVVELRVSK